MSRKIYTEIKNNLNGSEIKGIRLSMGLSQVEFGKLIGITNNYLSDVENNKKTPSDIVINSINRINAEFKNKNGDPPVAHRIISTPTAIPETTSVFQKLPPHSREKEFRQSIRDLEVIFDSNNDVLIKAIQANLSAFKAAAKAEKEKLKMADDMDEMKKSIERLKVENKELKGCAGGSPPFSLTPDNCAPTGTEDPET